MSEERCPLKSGPGYPTPLDAMRSGTREKLLYVVAVQPNLTDPQGDYLATVDIDPDSETYCKVIHRTYTNATGNELHHSGWNTCSSCFKCTTPSFRDKLILPCINSNRVYVMDVSDERKPEVVRTIDGTVMLEHNVSAPHTTHCLPNGKIMISTMGDRNDRAKGDFIMFDGRTFDCLGTWVVGDKKPAYGYDFWYQPFHDVLVASEWGAPYLFKKGFQPTDLEDYGHSLNFYQWSTGKLTQTIDLGVEGTTPLEIRFLHNPKESQGYVGCALYANVFRFWKDDDIYKVEKVIDVEAVNLDGTLLNGLMSDILISLDDRFLYFTNWLHGDVRQYNIEDPKHPKLTGQIFLGGKGVKGSDQYLLTEVGEKYQRDPCVIKGRRLEGGPQMLQLSLDGKRLYISSSLYSVWDRQYYPEMVKRGGHIVLCDIDTVNGGMVLNEQFLVDFGTEPNGPALPHEMRYPGGDCTSDIWLT